MEVTNYVSLRHIATRLNVSHETVRQAVKRGTIEAIRFGRVYRVPAREIARIENQTVARERE